MSNRLAEESSPYLLQHAENPVDWYPWGEEALAMAKELDRPILLSIGYSSCHWCHVMAHESFEDPAIAELMNGSFVNIKVDREERPDIDAIYMEAAQAISGHGGWPLTVFLDTEQVPFFAGTYFPPEPRPSMPSFQQILLSIDEAWQKQRDEIEGSRQQMIDALSRTARLQAPTDPINPETLERARATLAKDFDGTLGGFTGAPKFPSTSVIDFLLGQEDEQARANALFTLGKMADGGIHDQIGGGFARYSVDARWHIPHFEKMLYDNALLARNYLHAWQLSGDDRHSTVVRTTLDWMLAELRGNEGGFASALDADSLDRDGHLEEGAFYAWDIDELREVIESVAPGHVGDLFTYWGVIDHGEFEGRNVLFVNAPEKRPPDEVVDQVRLALYRRRADRPWPARDDKRIASWNALAISALAEAGAVLNEPQYLTAALTCAEFVERELRTPDGRVIRSWLDGKPGPPGYLEDHAYLAAAYLTLYESTGEVRWFQCARDLADLMIERFEDAADGGFFSVADDHERLIVRRKDIEDSPIPSGNSAAALVLLRLSALTADRHYEDSATRALQIVQPVAARFAIGFGHALQAIAFHVGPVREIALVGDDTDGLLAVVRSQYRPRSVLSHGRDDDGLVPLLADRSEVNGLPTAFVCNRFVCEQPVTSVDSLKKLLA